LTLVLLVIGAVVLLSALLYNSLVTKRIKVRRSFAGVDVQLTKRYGLIPNLVEVVRGYADHERDVLTAVTEARNRALLVSGDTPEQRSTAAEVVTTVNRLLALAESYPELRADAQFRFLMRSLNEVEAQIAAARRTFNMAVQTYNTAIETLPAALVASRLGFEPETYFEASPGERLAVTVDLTG